MLRLQAIVDHFGPFGPFLLSFACLSSGIIGIWTVHAAGGSDQHNYHQDQHHHLRLFIKGIWSVHAAGGPDQQAQPGRLPCLDCLPHRLLHDRFYFSVIYPTIAAVNGCVWVA